MLSIFFYIIKNLYCPFFPHEYYHLEASPLPGGGEFHFFISREYSRRSLFTAGRRRKESTCHIFLLLLLLLLPGHFFQTKIFFSWTQVPYQGIYFFSFYRRTSRKPVSRWRWRSTRSHRSQQIDKCSLSSGGAGEERRE
jgi:hypothetical protein